MDFAFDARTEELRAKLLAFMDEHVYPAEAVAEEQRAALASPWDTPAVVEELKAEARRQGLWNLFLPDAEHGAGLTNLQYAPLAEITGRSPQLAPTATNCAAPDTGNMEVLSQFGDEQQRKQWLEPLLAGEIRSAFAMTEPEVASSDATNITTHIERDGDEYVITGRKWYISGAMNPDCKIFIVMGKTDPDGTDIRRQQSMVLVPRDTPGVTVKRAMKVFGNALAQQGVVHNWIADARVTVEQLRLLVLKTAWLMDTVGNRGAHTEIQAIKIATPRAVVRILDDAVQLHGAGGVSQDFPLAELYAGARTLMTADGPDEVHQRSLARRGVKKKL